MAKWEDGYAATGGAAGGWHVAAQEPLLPEEVAFLEPVLGRPVLRDAATRAERRDTSPAEELMAAGVISENGYLAALARYLKVPFQPKLPPARGSQDAPAQPAEAARLGLLSLGRTASGLEIAAAPKGRQVSRLMAALREKPALSRRLVLTGRQSFLDGLLARAGKILTRDAADTMECANPGLSARGGASRWQWGGVLGVALAVAAGTVFAPAATLFLASVVASLFFLLVTEVRLACVVAALWPQKRVRRLQMTEAELPVYTLLVPLYREARVVERLIAELSALDYPASKLDVKLLVEADDNETQRALARRRLPHFMEVVALPDTQPKTKPKALNVGLALARGQFVGIFDAEDRPHPQQLREAAAAFAAAPPDVACHQARLAWYNWSENWLTRQFAIEYASLFDVLLPALARLGLPLPLGGTSNHFRTDVLRKLGGWDAWNVTEDAELGVRLYRAGYRSEMLRSSTWEEAPNRLVPWLKQRTRWLKGWLQTYVAHMRRPVQLARRLGWSRFLAFQALIGGVFVSTLVHPIFAGMIIYQAFRGNLFLDIDNGLVAVLTALSVFNLVAGYAAGYLLALVAMFRRPMPLLTCDVPAVPAYWLLISLAGWRAVWQFMSNPHLWEKTSHGLTRAEGTAVPRLRGTE